MLHSLFYEKGPLKKPRLGVPDVYPQEAKQKEDELNPNNVKNGFQALPQISEEYGTARNCNVTLSKVNAYFSSISGNLLMIQKEKKENNTRNSYSNFTFT